MDTLKFALGDEDKPTITVIRNILQSNGHIIVCEENDGPSLLRKIRSIIPDFIIVSYNLRGMNGAEIAKIALRDKIAPTLLIAESSQDIFIREMGSDNFPYLIKPISQVQLLGTVEYVYANFKRLLDLEKEVLELKNMLEARKLVERAKGLLIDNYNMKEKDAFRFMQKKSMDLCKPMEEIAKKIIDKVNKEQNK